MESIPTLTLIEKERLVTPARFPTQVLTQSFEFDQDDEMYGLRRLSEFRTAERVVAPFLLTVRKTLKEELEKEVEIVEDDQLEVKSYFEGKPSMLFKNLTAYLTAQIMDLPALLHETADILKFISKSNGVVMYLVDDTDIYQIPHYVKSERHIVNWKIGEGSTLAAFVAYTKEHVMTEEILADPRYPLGLGWKDSRMKAAICAPVLTPDNTVIAVVELSRFSSDNPYSMHDLKIVLTIMGWAGVAIHQNQQQASLRTLLEINSYLLDYAGTYISKWTFGGIRVEKWISEILYWAKETMYAKESLFYILSEEIDEDIVVSLYEEYTDGENPKHKMKIRKRLTDPQNIATHAARLMKIVNIDNVAREKYFYVDDSSSGSPVKSVIMCPLIGGKGAIGLIQMNNKMFGIGFTSSDEQMFKTFAEYCALAVLNTRIVTNDQKMMLQEAVWEEMLAYTILPYKSDLLNICSAVEQITLPNDFYKFPWYPDATYINHLPELSLLMVDNVLGNKFASSNNLPLFLSMIIKAHRPNPFHDFECSFYIAHTMANILIRYSSVFPMLEMQALLLGSFCLNVDHCGYAIDLYITIYSKAMSELYGMNPSNRRIFHMVMRIINASDMFSTLSSKDFNKITGEIENIINSYSYMDQYLSRAMINRVLKVGKFSLSDHRCRALLKTIIISASALSYYCKPIPVTLNRIDKLYEEYFVLGGKVKHWGLCPISILDSDCEDMKPEDQVDFITFVVLPCMKMLNTLLPNTHKLTSSCNIVRDHWCECIKIKGLPVWMADESYVKE